MCVLAVWVGADPKSPLLIAANRDESYLRPSAAPAEIEPGIVAGQDLERGGTWLGWNAEGLVVGVTNRSTPPRTPESLSRGEIALEALRCRKLACIEGLVLRRVREHPVAGFNLLAIAPGRARCLHYDGTLRPVDVGPGVHVLSSDRDLDDPGLSERAVVDRLAAESGALPPLSKVERMLGSHDGSRPICKHGDSFGTVSSSILILGGGRKELYYADGPPCRTKFRRLV